MEMAADFKQIDVSIDALFAAVTAQCSDLGSASEFAGSLERLMRRLDAVRVAVVDEVDRTGIYGNDGHRTAAAWTRFNSRTSHSEATRRVRTAHLFRDLNDTASAYRAGEVGTEQVDTLAQLRANPRCGDQLAASEDLLLNDAQTLSYRNFRICTSHWLQLADADGREQDHESQHEHRHINAAKLPNGGVDVRGTLGPVQGDEFTTVFEKFIQAERLADWEEARAKFGEKATKSDLARTERQRRADAFIAMANQAASTSPGAQRPEPITHIIVNDTIIEDELIRRAGGTPPPADPRTYREYRCETLNGTPLTPAEALDALIRGTFRRVVLTPGNVSMSRKARLFTGPLRTLLNIRDGHCTFLDCDAPAHHCQGDHTEPYRQRQETSEQNGNLKCGHHNRTKERGYNTWRDPAGTWHTTRPDGTEIIPRA